MTDPLRAYFRPSAAHAVREVLLAARAAATTPELLTAEATRGNQGRFAPGGLYDPEVFGPSLDRWARIDAAGGLVHRRLSSAIARCLAMTEREVWRVAYFEARTDGDRSGPEALRALLRRTPVDRLPPSLRAAGFRPADLILDVVPVVPPRMRPLRRFPGGARLAGAATARYQVLFVDNARLAGAHAVGAPAALLEGLHSALQTAFEGLCVELGEEAAGRGGLIPARRPGFAFRRGDRFVRPVPRPRPRLDGTPDPAAGERLGRGERARPIGCAFAGRQLLLCFPTATVVVSPHGGVLARFAAPGARPVVVSPSGTAATFECAGGLRARDLTDGRWLERPPPALPLVELRLDLESVTVADLRVGAEWEVLESAGDVIDTARLDPAGSHAWIENRAGQGGIYSCRTGLRVFDTGGDISGGDGPGRAFALGKDGEWRFVRGRELRVGGVTRWRAAAPVAAAAFDRSGDRLLLADGRRVTLVERQRGGDWRTIRRFPLPRLRR